MNSATCARGGGDGGSGGGGSGGGDYDGPIIIITDVRSFGI